MEKALIYQLLSSRYLSARYQMQQRNATLARFFSIPAILLALLIVFSLIVSSLFAPTVAVATSLHAPVARAQAQPTNQLPFPFVLPTENGSISLSAHIVELSAFDNGENGVGVSAVARFRLKNSALTSAFTIVRFSSPVNAALPADLAVTMDGVPANVYVTDGGGLALNVELAAEGSTELQLTYSLSLPKTAIQAIRYPAALLTNWQQRISMSVRIQLPESVVAESVVQIAPDDWIFPTDAGQSYAVRWLYDGVPSEQPFSVAFIQPALWGEIVQARQAAMAGSVSDYLRLGDIYASLLGETTGDLRQSFYAQTLAAYNDGIQHSPDPGLSADLQQRIAQIYRSQIVNGSGVINPDYAQLTVNAVDAALATLAPEDGRRTELLQWRTDALSVLFNEARQRNDWLAARQILEQLGSTAEQNGNSKFVAEARRRLVVQQALQLLEDGNRHAAITLAGQEIGAAELRAPAELTSLFESWQVTATISPAGTEVDWIGVPAAEQSTVAAAALQELLAAWKTRTANQGYQFSLAPLPVLADGATQPSRLTIRLPAGASGVPLVEATPLRTDWALFRLLLTQLTAQIEQSPQLFRQELIIRLNIDLRTAADQWNTMAANLEQRAALFETQASAGSAQSDADAEALLRARIQLANYRGAAKVWSSLARNSAITVKLTANSQTQEQSRTWLMTPTAPAQTMQLDAAIVNWGRVLAAFAVALFALFITAGVLWWLL